MSWKEQSEGGRDTVPMGYNMLTARKCIRQRKDGSEFRTDKGPFLMVVYVDDDGAECSVNYFLTAKAEWKIARDMARLGLDMDGLDERGVKITDFLDPEFALNELEGRTSWANVQPGRGNYPDVTLCRPDEVPQGIRDAYTPPGPVEDATRQPADDTGETDEEPPERTDGEADSTGLPF